MITNESLEMLKTLRDNWETIDEAIEKWEAMLDIQRKREETGRQVFAMNEFFQEKNREWAFDDIHWDINAIVDRTQELMKKEIVENI